MCVLCLCRVELMYCLTLYFEIKLGYVEESMLGVVRNCTLNLNVAAKSLMYVSHQYMLLLYLT